MQGERNRIDMSTRCAICGSKNVVKEFKKEGYDVTKGVVGTVLVGMPGALAGAGGKDVTYYHCADCGQVMNRPMYQVTSDWIDKLLENPDMWKEALKSEKAKYKNIEWDENSIDTQTQQISQANLSYEEKHEIEIRKYMEKIVQKLQQVPYIEYDEIYVDDSIASTDAVWRLYDQGRTIFETINSVKYWRLVTDPNEMRELFIKRQTENYMLELVRENSDMYKKLFLDNIERGKYYTKDECYDIQKKVFGDKIDFETPYYLETFHNCLMGQLYKYKIEVNDTIVFKTEEEFLEDKRKEEEEKRKEKEAQARADENLKQMILDFLKRSEKYFAISEMIRDSAELSECTTQKLTPLLKDLEREGRVDLKVEKKRNYYAIAGLDEILRKRREEERRVQRENLNKQLEIAEEKYNKELETLQKQLSEQEAIFEANKSKIFGAGAKAKREAKRNIEYYSNQISKLKSDYMIKKSSLQAELYNI